MGKDSEGGNVRILTGTPDEMVIDPKSRAPVTLPAYRVAQLVTSDPDNEVPMWNLPAVSRALARYVRSTPEAAAIKAKPTLIEWSRAVELALDDGVDVSRAAGVRDVVKRAQRLHRLHANEKRRAKRAEKAAN